MKKEWTDVVQRQLEAYNKRDLDAFCACFHPEVAVTPLDPSRPKRNGMKEFREAYRALFEGSPNLRCEIVSRIVLEDSVLDEEHVHGSRGSDAVIHAVAIYAFRDDLIDRVWFAR
jgi:hypothetical protein